MTAKDILAGASVLGVRLRLEGGRVLAGPAARLTPTLREAIRSNVDGLREELAVNTDSQHEDGCHGIEGGDGVPIDLTAPPSALDPTWNGLEARRLWWRIGRALTRQLEAGGEPMREALEAIEAQAVAHVDARDLGGLSAVADGLEQPSVAQLVHKPEHALPCDECGGFSCACKVRR